MRSIECKKKYKRFKKVIELIICGKSVDTTTTISGGGAILCEKKKKTRWLSMHDEERQDWVSTRKDVSRRSRERGIFRDWI